jgi:hypothetical protein
MQLPPKVYLNEHNGPKTVAQYQKYYIKHGRTNPSPKHGLSHNTLVSIYILIINTWYTLYFNPSLLINSYGPMPRVENLLRKNILGSLQLLTRTHIILNERMSFGILHYITMEAFIWTWIWYIAPHISVGS